jgi:hypothetical protein
LIEAEDLGTSMSINGVLTVEQVGDLDPREDNWERGATGDTLARGKARWGLDSLLCAWIAAGWKPSEIVHLQSIQEPDDQR